jgi:SNF family Na+-dependent transporter
MSRGGGAVRAILSRPSGADVQAMAISEQFTSRWGLIVAGLGMAVGTGSMWRFPRVTAQYGGAAFLIPWLVFLFVWSIPLLLVFNGSIGRARLREKCEERR